MISPESGYTPEELMAVILSREVRDFETVAVGLASPIPAAACLLAKELDAPRATFIILGSPEHYPFPAGSSELHFLAQRGELDLFFLSGLQIDRSGNINLHVIGDYESPRLRLPGAYGSAMLYYMAHRVILFRTEHTPRTFVEKVDFITAPGKTPPNVHREGGPTLLVTPRAVISWNKERGEWVLSALNPGSTLDEVKENTGFPLPVSPDLKATPPPSEEELLLLRTAVRARMKAIYPEFAADKIRAP